MNKHFSIEEAKVKLAAIVHSVERGSSIGLTRRGKPVAVVMSVKEYERLRGEYENFWDAASKLRRIIKHEGIDISDKDFQDLRDHGPGRDIDIN